jgi:sensor histidine kinase regulating citrate/malate metabolism
MKAVRRALRKHLSPLGGDTVTMLDLPPVRMGLLTKLNLLTIGLIFLTAVAVTAYHFTQTWRDEPQRLKTQAASMLGIMTDLAEYGIHTSNRAYLAQILDSLSADPNVAYVAVLDPKQQVVAERRFAPALAKSGLPPLPGERLAGRITEQEIVIDGQRYIELVAPISSSMITDGTPASDTPIAKEGMRASRPIGMIRLGMSLDVQRKQFREQVVGAIGVVGLLVVFAILATLLLTRRLVAPMRRLMRAAPRRGFRPPRRLRSGIRSDELGC